jgi:hypothetical protein
LPAAAQALHPAQGILVARARGDDDEIFAGHVDKKGVLLLLLLILGARK